MAEIIQYPYTVELPLSRGYITIIAWFESQGITEYDHESFWRGDKPYVTYLFKLAEDATVFALKWC